MGRWVWVALLLSGWAWGIEEKEWVLRCVERPGDYGLQNGEMKDTTRGPLNGAPENGLWSETWGTDAEGGSVTPGWTSAGKEPVVYLRGISLASMGEPPVQCWAPEIPPAAGPPPALWCVVVLYVVDGVPLIYFSENQCVSRHQEFPGEWVVRMSWRGGRLVSKAAWNTVGPWGKRGFVTDGTWRFEAVRRAAR